MRSPKDMQIIQIDITNACVHSCSNCTRFCGHHKKPFMMDFDTFKNAVDSLADFSGTVGIIGGEPTLHPEFEKFVGYIRDKRVNESVQHLRRPVEDMLSYIRKNMCPKEARVGLWSSLNTGYYKHFEVINDTFKKQLLNDHDNTCLHQALLMPRKELGISDEEWLVKRDACWIQNTWSATITPKGAFFCEVAGAMDMLFNGPGGWPVEPGWWQRTPEEFGEQLQWCEMCSGCLDVPKRISNDERDDVTVGMFERLKEIGSPKARNGGCLVHDPKEYDKSQYHTFTGVNDYMEAAGNKRISTENRNIYPKAFYITTRDRLADDLRSGQLKDWVILSDNWIQARQAEDYFKDTVINPGCLYVYGEAVLFNVLARSVRDAIREPENLLWNIWGYYPPDKIIQVSQRLPKGKTFAIYGAGDRGKYAMQRLDKEHWRDAKIAAWVDSCHEDKPFPVQAPEVLRDVIFDYVIIAVEKVTLRDAIKKRLAELGVGEEKILWTMDIPW